MKEGPVEIIKSKRHTRVPKIGIRRDGSPDTRHKVLDWNMAYDQFLLVYKPKGMTQRAYAETVMEMDHTYVSTNFVRIESERILSGSKTRMTKLLETALLSVEASLKEKADYSPSAERNGISAEFKNRFGLDAFKAMADRLGFSPQAVNIAVTQNSQTNIVIPPLFAQQYADDAKKMLGE